MQYVLALANNLFCLKKYKLFTVIRLEIDSIEISVTFLKKYAFFACKGGALMVYRRYNNCFEGVAPQRSKYKI